MSDNTAGMLVVGLVIWSLYTSFFENSDSKTEHETKAPSEKEKENRFTNTQEDRLSDDPLKQKGDAYEKFIGQKFEAKGELVIYNGFIRGYEDRGVDIISLNATQKAIHLIQCKNWTYREMKLTQIEEIYRKLHQYTLDIEELDTHTINTHLVHKRNEEEIEESLVEAKNYTSIRKTLYIASEKVINPEIGKHLKMIQPNIFRYEDMKIVFVVIS